MGDDRYGFLKRPLPVWPDQAVARARIGRMFGPKPLTRALQPSPIVGRAWFCFAGPRRVEEVVPPPLPGMPSKTLVLDYCGAPPGVRCSCGTQLAGHDPGDEDARAP